MFAHANDASAPQLANFQQLRWRPGLWPGATLDALQGSALPRAAPGGAAAAPGGSGLAEMMQAMGPMLTQMMAPASRGGGGGGGGGAAGSGAADGPSGMSQVLGPLMQQIGPMLGQMAAPSGLKPSLPTST